MTTSPQATRNHDAQSLRQELVATLVGSGALHMPALQQAFLTIPREAFVPCFYEEDEPLPTTKWKRLCAHETPSEAYLARVYEDQPLVTKLDARGRPISSSSRPSAMAKMLEALDVRPGQRVLEIGTGTGYNAALIATLTSDPCTVVSIEHDPVLAEKAAEILACMLGPGLQVVTGDGFTGYAQGAPFDRIITTASVATIPMAWVAQLRVGGRIVMDLQGSLASGFLVLERTEEGVYGHFLPQPLHFMPLVTSQIEVPHLPNITHLSQEPCYASFVLPAEHAFPDNLANARFRWYLQWRIAGCQISRRKQRQRDSDDTVNAIVVMAPKTGAIMRFRQRSRASTWEGDVYGVPHFWEELQQVYAEFLALGEPSPQQYQMSIEQGMAVLTIGSLRLLM